MQEMKTYISILLSVVIALLPVSGSAGEGPGQQVQVITVRVAVPEAGQDMIIPNNIPPDVQEQVRRVLETDPPAPQFFQGIATWIVMITIVVVVGIILYCLWKCSQLIPPPPPLEPADSQEPPRDPYPALAGPHALVYNLEPAAEYELQYTLSLENPQWVPICILRNPDATPVIPVSAASQMFFRLVTH